MADSPEAENDESDGGAGVAIACPECISTKTGASASEVSSTVVACGGTVVYVADMIDLGRGEGLFDYLGPAIERLLAFRAMAEKSESETLKNRPSTLIVVFNGVEGRELTAAKKTWEGHASQMLSSIIQPSGSTKAIKLEDVFDRIEYLSSSEVVAVVWPLP